MFYNETFRQFPVMVRTVFERSKHSLDYGRSSLGWGFKTRVGDMVWGRSQPPRSLLYALIGAGSLGWTAAAYGDTQIRIESYLDVFAQSSKHDGKENSVLWWNRANVAANFNLTDQLAFNFGGYLSFTAPSTLRGPPSVPGEHTISARYADITALNLRLKLGQFDLIAGKDGLKVGMGELYSPLEVLEPVNINDPLHTFNMGVWQFGADVYLSGDDSISVRVLPFDERSRLPASHSRWNGGTGDLAVIDIATLPFLMPTLTSIDVHDRFRDANVANWGYLALFRSANEGFDYSGGVYYGPGLYPALRAIQTTPTDVLVLKQRADTAMEFATLTWAAAHWKAYGELTAQQSPNGVDDDFLQGMVGVSYDAYTWADLLNIDSIALTMEYTGDRVTGRMHAIPLRFSSQYTRPYRNSLLWEADLGLNSDFTLYGKANVNATSWDSAVWFGARYRYTDNLTLHLQVNIFNGDPNTPFGRWRSNDGMFFGFEYAL